MNLITARQDQQATLDKVVERVSRQFPELDRETIVDVVGDHYRRFDGSPIRDYLPILVERSVRTELARRLTVPALPVEPGEFLGSQQV